MSEENPAIAPDTRFYDDLVLDAVQDGFRQVVLLAAGMGTRAFRLSLPVEVIVFEPRAAATSSAPKRTM